MNQLYIVFSFISIAVGGIMYAASDNYYLGAGSAIIYLLASFIIFVPEIIKYKKAGDRYHECFHFINNFVISLSIKKSIPGALESTSLSMSQQFQDMFSGLANMNEDEKLRYLTSYFPFYVYSLFLQVIDLWTEQGGDILKMSNYLLAETRYEEDYLTTTSSITRRKYIEIASLWAITLAILVLLRFALRDFYNKIKLQPIYIIALAILSLFVLFSIYMVVSRVTDLKLKGYKKNEKIV